ncbi:MAG: rod shape-determining protein [Rickettsiales bacterium]|nr:rod shape-determining protein [Rickettsiales bacterium]
MVKSSANKLKHFKTRFKSLLSKNSCSFVGIDLGTTNTLIYAKDKGVVLNEASVVAYVSEGGINSGYLYGNKAKDLIGKTPIRIEVSSPLDDGVISDNSMSEDMIRHFLSKTIGTNLIFNPTVIAGVPISATNVEKKAIQDSLERCNIKEAFLVYESMAAAVGAGLPVDKPCGSMIIDIGGGTTEIAIISLGGIIKSRAFKYGGKKIDRAILDFIRQKYHLLIGENTAEDIKKKIGIAYLKPYEEPAKLVIHGRDLLSHTPKEVVISQDDIVIAMSEFSNLLIENVRQVLEIAPPELMKDIVANGAVLCGGVANIKNLDYILEKTSNLKVVVPPDPLMCVINGLGKIVEDYKSFDHVLFKQF